MASKSDTHKKTTTSAKKTVRKKSIQKRKSPQGKSKPSRGVEPILRYEIQLIGIFAFTIFTALSLHLNAMGMGGGLVRKLYLGLFGRMSYAVPYVLAAIVFLNINPNLQKFKKRYIGAIVLVFLAFLFLFSLADIETILELLRFNNVSVLSSEGLGKAYENGMQIQGGGMFGFVLTYGLKQVFGQGGMYVLIGALFIVALLLGTKFSLMGLWEKQKTVKKKMENIEISLPRMNLPEPKPKAGRKVKKQIKTLKKTTPKVVQSSGEYKTLVSAQDSGNYKVRESLRSKVRDFRIYDSDIEFDSEDIKNSGTNESVRSAQINDWSQDEISENQGQSTREFKNSTFVAEEESSFEQKDFEMTKGSDQNTGTFTFGAEISEDTLPNELDMTEEKPVINKVDDEISFSLRPKSKEKFTSESSKKSASEHTTMKNEIGKDKNQKEENKSKSVAGSIQKTVPPKNYIAYKKPPLTLLNSVSKGQPKNKKDVLEKAEKLEMTLKTFGVEAKVVQISRGPTITMFELELKPGVKVSKITGLTDDIALSLAAHQVRIIAPIPGKSAVGVEIPNEDKTMVGLKDVLDTEAFRTSNSKLTCALGKDISGRPVFTNLAKMPHLLIAGATGSGKSVCVNTLISSILFNATPDEVKFLMIDPKVVELNTYNGIPHLILPVVTDPKKAAVALNWAVEEMTKRYQLFAETGTKDVDSYNRKLDELKNDEEEPKEKLPKVVIIIDELADLMMVAPDQVEDAICRLAQMARAAGMHLIVATQRPSVDVITGIIKANIPSRIAFSVSSQTDSRTILDMSGAEKLLGMGDMLYYPTGLSKPKRIQGAFVSDEEVARLVKAITTQVGEVEYNQEILEKAVQSFDKNDEVDEHLEEAIALAIHTGQASASMIQRKFRVGYNRAARIVDEMEERGIVGPSRGSKPREVLLSEEEYEELSL